jgi:hypothetical protein
MQCQLCDELALSMSVTRRWGDGAKNPGKRPKSRDFIFPSHLGCWGGTQTLCCGCVYRLQGARQVIHSSPRSMGVPDGCRERWLEVECQAAFDKIVRQHSDTTDFRALDRKVSPVSTGIAAPR